jgi:hypothetical protein
MARCRTAGTTVLRLLFERGVRDAGKGHVDPAVLACVIRRLRTTVSESEIVAQFEAPGTTVKQIERKGTEAAQACGAAGGAAPALS